MRSNSEFLATIPLTPWRLELLDHRLLPDGLRQPLLSPNPLRSACRGRILNSHHDALRAAGLLLQRGAAPGLRGALRVQAAGGAAAARRDQEGRRSAGPGVLPGGMAAGGVPVAGPHGARRMCGRR
ncbi:hypothetical protein CLOM_g910 [Closterium sp. NIES-68]|nr:hypothetical protein CLOM_g910 [Closterium sp. NIES-68]